MAQQAQPQRIRPLHTASFYAMRIALIVLVGVVFSVALPSAALAGGSVGLVMSLINTVVLLIGIRSGKTSVPKLSASDSATYDSECRFIEKSLLFSVLGTMVAAAGIATLFYVHRIAGPGATAVFIAFNIYGWFT